MSTLAVNANHLLSRGAQTVRTDVNAAALKSAIDKTPAGTPPSDVKAAFLAHMPFRHVTAASVDALAEADCNAFLALNGLPADGGHRAVRAQLVLWECMGVEVLGSASVVKCQDSLADHIRNWS